MSAPIFWIFIPSAFSILLFLINRAELRYFLFISISIFLALITIFTQINPSGEIGFFEFEMKPDLIILGRSFVLFESDLFLVGLLYFINAFWGVFAYLYRMKSRIVPLGMLFTGMVLAAYAVSPFLYSALIIEIAIILSVPLLTHGRSKDLTGISRYLTYQTLALPFILLAGWFLAGGEITPVNPSQLIQATLLLGLGFVLWLGVIPFHAWIPILHRDLEPINNGYILQILISVLFLVILKFVNGFSWLRQYTLFYNAVELLGIVMCVLGGVGTVFQKDFREIAGYSFLHMVGMLLVGIGILPEAGVENFSSTLAVFLFNISLMNLSIELFEHERGGKTDKSTEMNPIAIFGFCLSLLSISGMPLSLGFPPNQWMYQFLARTQEFYLIALLGSKILIAISAMLIFKSIYARPLNFERLIPKNSREWIHFILVIIAMFAGLFPQFIYSNFNNLVSGFENLIQ